MRGTIDFNRLFNPSSLAIIGASKDGEKSGGRFLKSLIDDGFKGILYPVNPRETEIMGLKNYRRVLDIPGEVDLAILTVPARTVPQVMAECSQKRVRFAVVHSAGFSELGAEGKKLEEEMLHFARQGGTRIIGPNCMGIYAPKAAINTVVELPLAKNARDEAGSVAFVGQSGWFSENIIQMGYKCGVRFSKGVSIGNQSDLTLEDLLEYLGSDSETRIIVFYIEGFKQARRFYELAKQITMSKPVIVWKAGRSRSGIRTVASHTGSLAGNSVVAEAALTQSGATIARNLEEVIDLAAGFNCPVLPTGNKVGILVEAGGSAAAAVDAAEALGLEIPLLSTRAQQELTDNLRSINLPFSNLRNPVDLVWTPGGDNPVQLLGQCLRTIIREVDAVVMVSYVKLDDSFQSELQTLMKTTGKPIFLIPGHPSEHTAEMSRFIRNGVPTYTIPERALKALSALVRYVKYRQE